MRLPCHNLLLRRLNPLLNRASIINDTPANSSCKSSTLSVTPSLVAGGVQE